MRAAPRRTAPEGTRRITHQPLIGTILPPMSSGLRELKLWQESVGLAGDVVRIARAARRDARQFAERLTAAACAVAEAVADAHGRYDPRDQQRAYRTARRNLLVLETCIAIARQADILSAPLVAQLVTRAGNVSRLLSGYLAFLERQIAAEESVRATASDTGPLADRATALVTGSAGTGVDGLPVPAEP